MSFLGLNVSGSITVIIMPSEGPCNTYDAIIFLTSACLVTRTFCPGSHTRSGLIVLKPNCLAVLIVAAADTSGAEIGLGSCPSDTFGAAAAGVASFSADMFGAAAIGIEPNILVALLVSADKLAFLVALIASADKRNFLVGLIVSGDTFGGATGIGSFTSDTFGAAATDLESFCVSR